MHRKIFTAYTVVYFLLMLSIPFTANAACQSVTLGGTGNCAFVTGDILFGSSTHAIATSTNLFWDTFNNILKVNGTASTSALTISGISSGKILKTTTAGAVTAATANTDYQVPIVFTTTGTAGAATFDGTNLNIPNYTSTAPPYSFTPGFFGLTPVSATGTAILDYPGFIAATTTFGTMTATSGITNLAVKSALVLDSAAGLETAYAGSNPCTNQVALSISATGVIGCTSVTNAMLSNSTIGATSPNSTLTFGAAAALGSTFTGDLNLAHSNVWSVLQSFLGNASSTQESTGKLYVGQTATTTINGVGDLFVAGSTTLQNFTGVNATTTNATTTSFAITNAVSSILLTNAAGSVGRYAGTNPCSANQAIISLTALGVGSCSSTFATAATTITVAGTANQITSSAGAQDLSTNRTWTLSFPTLIIQPNASTTLTSNFKIAYFGGTSTSTIGTDGSITTPAQAHNAFTNSTTTNETVSSFLEIPHSSNPAPTVLGAITQSSNSPFQIHIGNGSSATVFDPRPAFTLTVGSSTALLATTTGPAIVIPFGLTVTNMMCSIQPVGATAEIAWQYANPTAYTSVITYLAASSTPGIITLSSSNAPTVQATTTLSVGNTTGGATSGSCTFFGSQASL